MLDPRLKLRHLQALVTLSRLRSVQASAEALARTPSALSKSLAELEALVGTRLFTRHRAGLEPTEAGQNLLREAHRSLAGLEEALDAAAGRRPAAHGETLRIGVLPTAAATLLPPAVLRLLALHPGTQVQVHAGVNQGLLALLRERQLDLVLGRLATPARMLDLSFEPLYEEPLILVGRSGHPLMATASSQAKTLAQLTLYPVVLPDAATEIRQVLDQYLVGAGLARLPQVVTTVSDTFARALVLHSDALWFCSIGVVAQELESGQLVAVPLDLSSTRAAVGLSVLAEGRLSLVALDMLELLRQQARRMRAGLTWPLESVAHHGPHVLPPRQPP